MRIASLQPAYLPWLGFFEQIHRADLFILYDDVEYHPRDWRNRNYIKTPQGKFRLTVPVARQPGALIKDARIDNHQAGWRKTHWGAIRSAYGRAPYFKDHAPFFAKLYSQPWDRLAALDWEIVQYLCRAFGLTTPVRRSSDLGIEKEFQTRFRDGGDIKTERILFMMKQLDGVVFYEGCAGKNYIDTERLRRQGIEVEYQNFQHREYRQLFGEFIPYLSAIDLLFNEGPRSLEILTAGSAVEAAQGSGPAEYSKPALSP